MARHGTEEDLTLPVQPIKFEDIIGLVSGNVVMVVTDMYRKNPSRGSGYMGLRENTHF